jgi:hypothetical protein
MILILRGVLLVLDEPTAALDAETEHALFERHAAAARGTKAASRFSSPIGSVPFEWPTSSWSSTALTLQKQARTSN